MKSTPKRANGQARRPETLSHSQARAVLEDAVMEAAADIAAISATLEEESSVMIAETPEEEEIFDLLGVPYLGQTRVRALAAVGIRTLDDLRAATAAEIGGVKGVGMRNAARIKEWLAAQDAAPPPASVKVAVCVNPDPDLAAINQTLQDDMTQIDQAITRIQQSIPQRISHKKLDRQVDKLLSVLSELAEGPDTLRPKQLRRALKVLHLIVALLDKFAGMGHVSDKIVVAFAEELRDRRKRLQNVLDPQKP
ncbi:MAG: helix-hairpin-helix domain-containing protein [Armatimonadetes bacterium]|nr:helix-hairpin-helix domain-containing protein [Armatimonadota bacterium]